MITYADLFQFCILLIALVSLCYQIFKGKKQPPHPAHVTAGYK